MKQILVSTDVYAAIWSERQAGEDDEDAILRRVLEVDADKKLLSGVGYQDARHDFAIGEGQVITRVYKGREYRAVAENNAWRMDGQVYDSLNKLSRAVTGTSENAWVNWYVHTPGQPRILIDSLRGDHPADESQVIERADYNNYEIKKYQSGTIIVDQEGSYAGAARPILREIAFAIGIEIINNNGRQLNTRQLGSNIIKELNTRKKQRP